MNLQQTLQIVAGGASLSGLVRVQRGQGAATGGDGLLSAAPYSDVGETPDHETLAC